MVGRVLHNLSGGVDSAFVAWDWLRQHPERLLIHHCHLVTKQKRTPKEAEAVTAILAWLRREGLDHFDFVESTFDYGTIGTGVYDIEVIGFISAVILRGRRYKDVDTILVPASANDMRLNKISERQERRKALVELMNPGKRVRFVYPIEHLEKRELLRTMPQELRGLTWSCRRPKNGEPCGKCHACRSVKALSTA